jgi:hypothetical protein
MEAKEVNSSQDIAQFKLLLWLKIRLMVAGRSNRAKSSMIISWIIFVPLSIWAAFTVYGYATGHPLLEPSIIRAVLALMFAFWILSPLAGFSLNDSYDPTKLFIYPVRYQTIFAANVVGSLLDMPTVLCMPIILALLLTAAKTPLGFVISALLLFLFVLQTIALGQAITFILLGFLKSRRFRDILVIVFPLVAALRYFLSTHIGRVFGIAQMLSLPYWNAANYLPPGWTEAAVISARDGRWVPCVGYSAALLLSLAVTIFAATFILKQLYMGEREAALSSPKTKAVTAQTQSKAGSSTRDFKGMWIPIVALAQKEWRYLVRDPQYKALAMNGLYVAGVEVFSVFNVIRGAHGETSNNLLVPGGTFASFISMGIPVGMGTYILFATMPRIFNIFGGEGEAVTMLLSFPTPRRYFVAGKNLAHGSVAVAMAFIATFGVSLLIKSEFNSALSLLWAVMVTSIFLAAGNVVSVYFPTKLMVMGSQLNRSGQGSTNATGSRGMGCLFGLIYLSCWIATAIAAIPAAATMLLPTLTSNAAQWYLVSIPLGILYCASLYLLSLRICDASMLSREFKIIKTLMPDQ